MGRFVGNNDEDELHQVGNLDRPAIHERLSDEVARPLERCREALSWYY